MDHLDDLQPPAFQVDEIFKTIPAEILGKIFSFCNPTDLLRLVKTCKTFKGIIVQNTKLMNNFSLVLNHFGRMNRKQFQDFFLNRRIASVKLKKWSKREKERILTFSTKESIEHFEIYKCYLSIVQLGKLLQIFPNVTELRLNHIRVNQSKKKDVLVPFRHDSLEHLYLNKSIPSLIFQFLNCTSLKRLTIDLDRFDPGRYVINGKSFWKLTNTKLKKLEIGPLVEQEFGRDNSKRLKGFEDFQEFLLGQTELEEITFSSYDISKLWEFMQRLPWIKRFNISPTINIVSISEIPHSQLKKLTLSTLQSKLDLGYQPEPPTDVRAFEDDFMKFLEKDSSTKGLKNSQLVKYLTIGDYSWLEADVALSKHFLKSLLEKLPKLISIEMISATRIDEITETIEQSGRELKTIWMTDKSKIHFEYRNQKMDERKFAIKIILF